MTVNRYLVFSYHPDRFTDISHALDGDCGTLEDAKRLAVQDETVLEVYDTQKNVWHRFHRISEDDAPEDIWVETPHPPKDDMSVEELRRHLDGRGPKLD